MTIPALSTADKLFICSYNIGSNIDHRKALGNINEITTFTSEYIDGFCWIPVNMNITDNNESWYWDLVDKDVVYVKVGVRISSDGYLHTWLLNTQKVSELILWNNNYNTTNQPIDDTTVLHLCIEKMYRVIFGNTTSFISGNIKFQNYISGSTRLYLFGNYNNSLTNSVNYTIDTAHVKKSSFTWYPNNSSTILSDYLYSSLHGWSKTCNQSDIDFTKIGYTSITKAYLDDGGLFTDYTTAFNNGGNIPLIPVTEEINDAFYYGYSYRHRGLNLNIGISGVGTAIVWEYWDGSTWSALSTSDGTNGFTVVGSNDVSCFENDWVKCDVNGINLYWMRSRVTAANFTTQPILHRGQIREISYWANFSGGFGKSPEHSDPIFYYHQHGVSGSVSIPSVCNPTDPTSKDFDTCHIPGQISAVTGNNSGRSYNVASASASPACPGEGFTDCGNSVSNQKMYIDYTPNRAYIWVPGYCSGASGGSQSECEANGGTWIPGHYECDPAFTYDSIVNFTYGKWTAINPDTIDYATAQARFLDFIDCYPTWNVHILAVYYTGGIYDTFNEYWNNDLDKLKHDNFIITTPGINTNRMLTIFTKHLGIGLLTSGAPTSYTNDWIITWGGSDYFSNWQTPDGLLSRTPTVTNTPYIRPITHHDEFNIIADEPVLGGFLYDLQTSNAFLSRDPGTETKIIIPVSHQTDFSFLYELLASNGFLSRDPGTETKIIIPVSHQTDFSFLYELLASNGFLSRDPGTETKIIIPVSHQTDFSFLYELLRPIIADLYHLELTGDNTKDGKSWTNAWKTWSYAMQNTPSERTLLVEEGTYNIAETQVEPDNSIVIYLVKNHIDDVSTVTVTI